jgi:hypothetical protein
MRMNSMSEKNFQAVVKYGPMVLGLCLLLNIWAVMRYREVYRDSIKSEVQVQQLAVGEQVAQAVLQEFSTRANSDPHIAEIFRQAQAQAQRNQLATPTR